MKFKYLLLFLSPLWLLSCSSTISTPKKEYHLTKASQLKSGWQQDPKSWIVQKDTLIGRGGPMAWSVMESKKQLPKNYEIDLKVNMTKESLFEIMLHIDKEKYIRTYLYRIEQKIIIGRGKYIKGSNEYNKHGGPSLFKKPINLQNDHWYAVKIRVLNNQLFFSVDNDTQLECSIEKNNLSQHGKLGFITNGGVKITDLVVKSI
ncbi:hypothetical protein [Flavobacterium poyangense]|uniref:hypothetical protein n=1 Tax=Flavobacterium poyangense TaxID=2204302 RepID=UPI001423F87F|nr:hypothetical protein [Flavobacterium sp. JXAS1]